MLEKDIEKLIKENEQLKKTIADLRKQLLNLMNANNKRARHDMDYLPYHEDERD